MTSKSDWAEQEIARIRADRDRPLTQAEIDDFPAKLLRDQIRYHVALSMRRAE